MLICGRFLETSNKNLQERLATAEVKMAQASAVTSSMAAEGRALGARLDKAEADGLQETPAYQHGVVLRL